jgi:adenine-specific DNA-methyltransferase
MKDDFDTNVKAEVESYLFLPPDKDFDELPEVCQKYIRFGEKEKFHTGYKCQIRKRWYITPSLWNPDGFALRQVGDYPKLVINPIEVSSTDTIHRVRFKTRKKRETVALSFLNSLTFAFSEIIGRSYGGGVLTFEPTEIEEIPLPILAKSNIDFAKIDALIREKKMEEALDIVDEQLLIKQLKFTQPEVRMLRGIWQKLSGRRNGRRN